MTREEEKNKARFEYVSKRLANPDFPTYNAEYELEAAFDKGAMWADQYPMTYDGKAMLYVNSRSHENGYKEAIEKACKWLDENFRVSSFDNTKIITHFSSMFDVLDSFRKAMKGE